MTFPSIGKNVMAPLLFVNLVMYVIVLALAGWSLDKYINGENHHHLRGNSSTSYLLIFSLLASVIGFCSVISGFMHLRAWRAESLAVAASSALVAWAITALSFGLTCKQIGIGNRGRRLRTLEAFVIILTITQLIYLVLLHAGIVNTRYGSGYRSQNPEFGMAHEAQKTSAPPSVI